MSIINRIFGKHVKLSINENENEIALTESGNEKVITFNNIVYSKLKKGSILVDGYWDYFLPLPNYFNKININNIKNKNVVNVLVIGLGAGTIPYQMLQTYNNVKITALETSAAMIQITKELLQKEDLKKLKIIYHDGYDYINKNVAHLRNLYDLIILDAYIDDKIPDVFFEKQFIDNINFILNNEGIFAINFIQNTKNDLRLLIKNLKDYYKIYYLNTGLFSGNLIILNMKNKNRGINNLLQAFNGLQDNIKLEAYNYYANIKSENKDY
ncbi:MAG: methyltransferase domain-containing protein [Candidatus Marsarchaeota archaeon]|jgi:spermidine synthase|nr:methyltransferase domain-containing protein [Candidatus Marsarchaeota archaeon]